jgi:hypothetical protein
VPSSEVSLLPCLEFWPDYGPGPLWHDGSAADLVALGLSGPLASRLTDWNSEYEERRLPVDGPGDPNYLAAGVSLLAQLREALAGRFRVVVTEPWWGEQPSDYER